MQCIIDKAILVEKLERVKAVTGRKTTIPILAFFRITTAERGLEIQATDLEITYKASLVPKIMEGVIDTCLPAQKVYEIAREMPDLEITFKFGETDCTISSGKAKFKIKTMSPENFPSLDRYAYFDDESASTISLDFDPDALRDALNQVSYAASAEASRFSLNDILVQPKDDGKVSLCATDGHRLSRDTFPCKSSDQFVKDEKPLASFRLPVRGATVWMGRNTNDASIKITASNRAIRLHAPSFGTYYTAIKEGQFPDIDRLFHDVKAGDARVYDVDAEAITNAIRRASLVADGRSSSIRLAFKEESIVVTSESPESGSCQEDLAISSVSGYSGEDVVVGLNATYLLDVTSRQSGNIQMRVKGAGDAILIQKDGMEAVIMPLRV